MKKVAPIIQVIIKGKETIIDEDVNVIDIPSARAVCENCVHVFHKAVDNLLKNIVWTNFNKVVFKKNPKSNLNSTFTL